MEYLTVSEVAAALGVSVPTVKRYIYEGRLASAKLPGGGHRIPRREVERVLGAADGGSGEPEALAAGEASATDRLAVLEQWVTELQADVERLASSLEVIARYCSRVLTPEGEAQSTGNTCGCKFQLLVLGPGCRRCDALYDLTLRVLRTDGHRDACVERVRNVEDIASFGPVVTPALVANGKLLMSGRVPTEAALRDALRRHLR